MKPFSEASEQNKQPILAVLREQFAGLQSILEIGSGTGQHALYFAGQCPGLRWQCSDVVQNLAGIRLWLAEAQLPNLPEPLSLNVNQPDWPADRYDGVFSANTAHIMDWPSVENLFAGVGRVLAADGRFCLYGPFSYDGRHTSDSNARFDAWLKQRDPASGIRDVSDLARLAGAAGLSLLQDYEMPVNNRTLVWRKTG